MIFKQNFVSLDIWFVISEFKIRNGKYMDKWLNSLTSVWTFTKVHDHCGFGIQNID